ncbi:MAG: glycosyltransferase [Bacteroidota bacterium]
MKVLLYSSTSRTREGGVQGVYASLADGLRRRGHEVVEGWSAPTSPPNPRDWTAPLYVPKTWRGMSRLRSLAASGRSALHLWQSLRRLRPDVVHVHFVRSEAAYFLALRALVGHRVVLTFHGSDLYRPDPVSQRVLARLARHADAVTAVSAPLQAHLQAWMPGREGVTFIPNGVDLDFWAAAQPCPAAPATVVAVGRLEPVKGFDVLIEAVRRLRVARDVRLHLIGDGRQRGALERQAAEAGLADAVTFAGHLDPEGVRDAFRAASVFALPSRSEGLPLALIEAQAAGLPVVATRVGGVPDQVPHPAGILVEPDDPAALAEALGTTLANPQRAARAGRAGREVARTRSADAMVEAYERLYEHILADRRLAEPALVTA